VAQLAALGLTNDEIAHKLGVAEPTVKVHLKGAMRRLDVRNRTDLVCVFPPEPEQGEMPKVTPREAEVLDGVCRGETNKQIAIRISSTEATVKTHIKPLMVAYGARNRTELARRAIALRKGAQAAAEPAEPTPAQA
jgi:DNA-binding NarL/FixJ family response regulator